ncbi:MAG: phage holin family protein [Calditrichaeota bacterium]|nr:MAG: phage holin family protein [Calditrichota bacterium]
MRHLLLRLFINAAAFWLVDGLFDGVWFESTGALLLTALIFGLLNTFIRPVLIIMTLPINILTLGLFTFVVNAMILELADWWVDRFYIDTFMTAILASIVISIVSSALSSILYED